LPKLFPKIGTHFNCPKDVTIEKVGAVSQKLSLLISGIVHAVQQAPDKNVKTSVVYPK